LRRILTPCGGEKINRLWKKLANASGGWSWAFSGFAGQGDAMRAYPGTFSRGEGSDEREFGVFVRTLWQDHPPLAVDLGHWIGTMHPLPPSSLGYFCEISALRRDLYHAQAG
jgi:hypothetical protein